MKLYIFDRKPSKLRLEVNDLKGYLSKNNVNYIDLDADSADSVQKMEIYGIVQFPAVLLTRNDGQIVRLWQGALPIYDEISSAYFSGE